MPSPEDFKHADQLAQNVINLWSGSGNKHPTSRVRKAMAYKAAREEEENCRQSNLPLPETVAAKLEAAYEDLMKAGSTGRE